MGQLFSLCQNENEDEPRRKLLTLFRKEFKGSIFKEVCLSTIKHFHQDEQEEYGEEMSDSITNYSGYDSDGLLFSETEYQSYEFTVKKHSRLTNLSPDMKIHHLTKLLEESYIFIDFTDYLQESFVITYDRCTRSQLFKGNLCGSFVEEKDIPELERNLLEFDPRLIEMLENYVGYCKQITQAMHEHNKHFLYLLAELMESKLINKYNRKFTQQSELNTLIEDTKHMISILQRSMSILFKPSNLPSHNRQSETTEEPEQIKKDQKIDLFSEMNLYTLVCELVFKHKYFHDFINKKIREVYELELKNYNSNSVVSNESLLDNIVQLVEGNPNKPNKTEIEQLFIINTKNKELSELFITEKLMLKSIISASSPTQKLKMFHQLKKSLEKSYETLRNAMQTVKNIELSYVIDRDIEFCVVEWLLRSCKELEIIISIFFTDFFIHKEYRVNAHGSSLASFIAAIHEIIR